jgi:hypothetical protein
MLSSTDSPFQALAPFNGNSDRLWWASQLFNDLLKCELVVGGRAILLESSMIIL